MYCYLEEEIYITQPEGHISTNHEQKDCKLNKAIYNLKQVARAWHTKIAESLKNLNFIQITFDTCLFTRNTGESKSYIIIYVDDILIVGKDTEIKEII